MSILDKYKNNEISLYEAITQLDLKNESNDKKNEGVIYTPKYIADYIVKNLAYTPDKTIIEPSVGHGVFIFSLIEYVEKNFKLKEKKLKEWFENKVFCYDINEQNINDLKSLLTIYFEKKNIKEVSFINIKNSDTLLAEFDFEFDFSFGNPPYVRTKNLEENYLNNLRKKYKSCKTGNIDLYYAFVELMNNISTISSFIVPNSYLYNASAKNLRKEIKNNLESIIDFKSKLIFENARTYTSIYKTNKKENSTTIKYKEKIEEDYETVNKKILNDKHWIFNEEFNNNEGKKSILELCDCYGSIATLKDKLYIIEDYETIIENGTEYLIQKHENKEYKIEKDICIEFKKLTKLDKKSKIIYPYINNEILSEEKLKEQYPYTYEYLKDVRNILDQRDKGKVSNYENWFAYGRRQGLVEKNNKYYLLLPLMATEKYTCEKIKHYSNFMSTSGFVLGFDSEKDADNIKEILESGLFFEYIKTKGKAWAGKNPYYSFSKTHLKDFYI